MTETTSKSAPVAVVSLPEGVADGWDAADAAGDGWDTERTVALLEAARSAAEVFEVLPDSAGGSAADGSAVGDNTQNGTPSGDGKRAGPPQRDNLIDLVDGAELWHSPDGEAYATVPAKGHLENWRVRSRGFKVWLAGQHYEARKTAAGGTALEDALRVIEARATHRGPRHQTFVRVGKHGGAVYVDLGGEDWRAVKVTAGGWDLVDRAPIKFVRSPYALPLPVPERGEPIDLLRDVINWGSEEDFKMVVAWLVAAFSPDGPYPVLMVGGEQGSAKSSMARALRGLSDPNVAPIRTVPANEKDLLIDAYNSRVLSYDNLPGLPQWLSDGLCRLSTGGGFGTRALYSNFDEVVFSGQRPIILNGIGDLSARPDLADRALLVKATLWPICFGMLVCHFQKAAESVSMTRLSGQWK